MYAGMGDIQINNTDFCFDCCNQPCDNLMQLEHEPYRVDMKIFSCKNYKHKEWDKKAER